MPEALQVTRHSADALFTSKFLQIINRTGGTRAVGDIVAPDLTGSDGDVTALGSWTATSRDSASPFANVIQPATAHLKGWEFGVVVNSDIADNGTGTVQRWGLCDVALAPSGTSNVTAGKRITATNGQNYASLLTDGATDLGQALGASAASEALGAVLFDGRGKGPAGAAA